MQIRSKFVVSVLALVGAWACGDDDGGGSGTGGVSRNKKVGELSESEARSLCKSLASKFASAADAIAEFSCTAQSAVSSGGDEGKCETAIGQCKKSFVSPFEELDCDGADGETGGVSEECGDVTVGELNDCMDANADALDDLAAMVSCSTDIQELGELSTSFETPAACTKIEAKCPDIADTELEP